MSESGDPGGSGEPIRHRAIYVSPADARFVDGELPVGTVLVRELREDVNGQPGAVVDALTIMVTRGDLETMCAGCHSLARESDFAPSAPELGR